MTPEPARRTDAAAVGYFTSRLAHETDCADVAALLRGPDADRLVVLDSRDADAYATGHVPGAHRLAVVDAESLAAFGDVEFVTYCWGPHCNGATKLAAHVADLGFPVREMLGGVWGWEQEGFALTDDVRL